MNLQLSNNIDDEDGEEDEDDINEDRPLQAEALNRRLTGAVKSNTFDSKPLKIKRLRS